MQTVHIIQAIERAPTLTSVIAISLAFCLAAWRAKVRAKQSLQMRRAVVLARRPRRVIGGWRW